MTRYYVTAINNSKVTVATLEGDSDIFDKAGLGVLVRFGVDIDDVHLSASGGVCCYPHDSEVDLPGELYIMEVGRGSGTAPSIRVRNMVTMSEKSCEEPQLYGMLNRGEKILGAELLPHGRVNYINVVGTNQESARFILATGCQGLVRNRVLHKAYIPAGVSTFTPGAYCDSILTHAVNIPITSRCTIIIDDRIKHIELGWLVSDVMKKVEVRGKVASDVIDILFDSPCEVSGDLSDEDKEYSCFLMYMLRGGIYVGSASESVLRRYVSHYKDYLLAEMEDAWMSSHNSSTRLLILNANANNTLEELPQNVLSAPFKYRLLTPRYIKAGGDDNDILSAYLKKVRFWR